MQSGRPGRPRKWQNGWRRTSIIIPQQYEKQLEELEKLGQLDGSSLNEMILQAINEYLANHIPGNPQTLLPSHIEPDFPKPALIRQKWTVRDLENDLAEYEKNKGVGAYRSELKERIKKQMLVLCSMNLILQDEKVKALVERADKILEEK